MLEIYSNIIVFLVMNSIVAVGAYQFLKLFGLTCLLDNLLAYALLFCSQIIITELVLGIFGRLTLTNLIILNLAVLLVALPLLRREPPLKGLKFSLVSDLLKNKLIAFAFSCILGFGIVKVLVNLINPPFGWDSLNYHFTFPVEWIKYANLVNPITISDDPSPTYFPMNGSLIFVWLVFPFKSAFLADAGQLPFFILCFIAVFAIARKIGVSREYSALAASLFVLIPNFFKQLEIGYVDVMLTSFILIAINFLLLLNENFNLKNLVICAVALGLAVGTKTISVVYGTIISVLFILILLKQKNLKKTLLSLIIYSLVVVLLGGFTFIRNFLLTKNFLYPVSVKIFGRTLFKGVMEMSYYKAHLVPRDYSFEKLLFHEGLGAQAILLIIPAIFLSIPLTLLKNKSKANIVFIYLFSIPFLMYLAYRYVIPANASRYLYSFFALGMVIAFYCLQILKINRRALYFLSIICILSSLPELARRAQVPYSLVSSSLIFVAAFINFKKIDVSRKTRIVIFCFFALIFIFGLGVVEKIYLENEFPGYLKPKLAKSPFWPDAANAWLWLNSHTDSSRIAYVGRPVPFPLYGRRLKNEVYYVSVNKGKPYLYAYPNGHYQRKKEYITLHRNLEEPGNYRENADYSVWLSNLLKQDTDYLFVYSLHQTQDIEFPLEDKWALANPLKFAPVFTNETVHIYKIVK